jgi:hypothetical protein
MISSGVGLSFIGFCGMVNGEGRSVAQFPHFHIQAVDSTYPPISARITGDFIIMGSTPELLENEVKPLVIQFLQ